MQAYMPVVSSSGKGLMPTTNRIAKGRVVRRFKMGLFYIQGSKKEALMIKRVSHPYLNVPSAAVTQAKAAEGTSTTMHTVGSTSKGLLSFNSLAQWANPRDLTFL